MIKTSTDTLYTVANNLGRSAAYLKIEKGELKTRHVVLGMFYSLFSNREHKDAIQGVIDRHVAHLNTLRRDQFISRDNEVTDLFIAAHRFNQSMQAADSKKLVDRVTLIRNENVPELCPITAIAKEKMAIIQGDTPETVEQRRYFKKYTIRQYPNDNINHTHEATSILKNTQFERLKGFLGRYFTRFQKYRYKSNNESDGEIYSQAAPMKCEECPQPTSYWLGHASLFLSVPLRSANGTRASFTVITDPVEGDLNALLYPRQTRFARPMESLPASHVYLLSHNHLDHYDKNTIKKLLSFQPIMIVPKGDGYRYTKMGFTQVVELDWWEKQTIELKQNNETYTMNICATPSRHWAGQGPCSGNESTFLGYVIEGAEGGDIYFAGDTARLSDDHINKLRDNFNIKWSFQPGGPDEVRKDMESTHQASVDALWMHFNLMCKKIYVEGMEKQAFLEAVTKVKTIYMHTMTFKLGNLHLSDTHASMHKVLRKLKGKAIELKTYEQKVVNELQEIAQSFVFSNNKTLTLSEVATILQKSVAVPKIGSRIGLESDLDTNELFSPVNVHLPLGERTPLLAN